MKTAKRTPTPEEQARLSEEVLFPFLKEFINEHQWHKEGLAAALISSAYKLLRTEYSQAEASKKYKDISNRAAMRIERQNTTIQ